MPYTNAKREKEENEKKREINKEKNEKCMENFIIFSLKTWHEITKSSLGE